MEAISGGASVLAFVVLGLKSAKVAYEVLSAIKDGSTHVAQATSSVQNLQSTLERLSQCRLVAEQQDAGLLKTAKECADNMKAFAEQLEKLVAPQHRVGKQWNKVKIFLKEDDLKRVSAAVVGHTAALNFYLQVLESDTILGVRDDVRTMLPIQQTIHDDVKAILPIQQTVHDDVKTILPLQQTIHDDVKAILPLRQTIGETQTTILTQHTTVTAMVQNSITQNRNEAHAIRETIQNSTQGLATQMDIQHLNDLLERVLRSHPPHEATSSPRVIEIADDGSTMPRAETDHEDDLEETIFFVIEALEGRNGIFADDEAQEICDALLDFLDKAFSSGRLLSLKSAWAGAHNDCELRALQVNLRAVKGAFLTSQRVSLNQGADPNRTQHFANGKILASPVTRRLNKLELRSGTISVLTTESRSKICDKYQVTGLPTQIGEVVGGVENSVNTTDTRITFIPRLQGRTVKGRGFEAILRNSQGYQGWYHGPIPRLFLNNVIRESSPVFQVVMNGELAKFQDMLKRGEASLRDQDEYGTPLLFYATRQPDMCRFLLEHGADIDYFASSPINRAFFGNALLSITDQIELLGSSTFDYHFEHYSMGLLLNAGCDPSTYSAKEISASNGGGSAPWYSFLSMACTVGSDDLIRMIYTRGLAQGPVSDGDVPGMWPIFIEYIRSGQATVAGISTLLQYGADIHTNIEGTCLHHLLSYQHTSRRIELLRCCEFLIRSGADVDAIDYTGRSVSLAAYCIDETAPRRFFKSARYLDSTRGDIWDRALAGAGFNVASFRRRNGIRRRAWYKYTYIYSREDFETMWAGMTELCPYYYDAEPPFDKFYSTMSLFGFRSLWRQWGEEVYPHQYEVEPPYDKSYSTKSLFGFRSLWWQWGEDVVVGRLEKVREGRLWMRRSTYDENDSEEEWSVEEEADYFNDSSDAESNGDGDGQAGFWDDQGSVEDDEGQSNIYDASDQGSDRDRDRDGHGDNLVDDDDDNDDDSDRDDEGDNEADDDDDNDGDNDRDNDGDNEADNEDDSDDDSDEGGCQLD